nr:MAG TPA: hypothetical protein [Caudoviricetes sp.]
MKVCLAKNKTYTIGLFDNAYCITEIGVNTI